VSGEDLIGELLQVLREMDDRVGSIEERPTVYLVGAGTLVLAGITRRSTQDLDFIADQGGDLLANIVTDAGVHSHRVRAGLVSMPRGWRERATPLPGFQGNHIRFLVPTLADRLIDKLSRGSATDWQDIEAIVRSDDCPEPEDLGRLTASLLSDPPSTVFDPAAFRANLERLAELYVEAGQTPPSP